MRGSQTEASDTAILVSKFFFFRSNSHTFTQTIYSREPKRNQRSRKREGLVEKFVRTHWFPKSRLLGLCPIYTCIQTSISHPRVCRVRRLDVHSKFYFTERFFFFSFSYTSLTYYEFTMEGLLYLTLKLSAGPRDGTSRQ